MHSDLYTVLFTSLPCMPETTCMVEADDKVWKILNVLLYDKILIRSLVW